MQETKQRVRSMRFTAYAVGASFLSMLFVLIALGVPWHSLPGFSEGGASLLNYISRNKGGLKKAGDPGFALLFIGGIFQLLATYALYTRWALRESRFPHSANACVGLFGAAALFTFLSFVVYSGIIHKEDLGAAQPGHTGAGFGLAVFIFIADFLSAVGLHKFRDEIDKPQEGTQEPAMAYTNQTGAAHPFTPGEFGRKFGKARMHSTVMGFAVLDILFLIMSLGLPWWEKDGVASYGLVQNFSRLPKHSGYREAGDPAFAFTFFAFLAQIYSTYAVTLRFLGREDNFSGRIPHTLKACLISTGISCFCSFLAFVIYAGVTNSKTLFPSGGKLQGGFGLLIIVWLLTASVIAVLILKKSEVDNAPLPPAETTPTAFPASNPLVTAGASAPPVPAMYASQPPPQFAYANPVVPDYSAPAPPPGYPQSYPSYVASPGAVEAPPEDPSTVKYTGSGGVI